MLYTYALHLDDTPLLTQSDHGLAILQQEVGQAVTAIVEQTATAARLAAPVNFGILRASIGTRVSAGGLPVIATGEVFTGSQAPYAAYVAYGTRPHFPPLAPLRLWAARVLGDERAAYAVARAISRRGTRPHERFRHAISTFPPDVQARLNAAIDRAAQRIGAA